ncbi:hypothetical protein GCM10027039_10000 [Terrabacter koreensis]
MSRKQPPSDGVGLLVGVGLGELGFGFGPPLVGDGLGAAVDDDGAGDVGAGAGGGATVEVDVGSGAGARVVGTVDVASEAGWTTAVAGAWVEDVPGVAAVLDVPGASAVPSDVPQPSSDGVSAKSEPGTSGKTPALIASSRQLSPDQSATAPVASRANAARAAAMTTRRRRRPPGPGRKSVEGSKDMAHQRRGTGPGSPVRSNRRAAALRWDRARGDMDHTEDSVVTVGGGAAAPGRRVGT